MFKYITFSLILIALLAANLLKWHDLFLGVFLTLIYLFYFGRRLGAFALSHFNHFWQRLFGPLLLLAGLSATGALVYYFYALPDWAILALLAAFPIGLIPYCHFFKKKIDEWPSGQLEAVPLVEPNTRPANRWAWLVILGDLYLFYYLLNRATVEAANSPWNFISYKFFLLFFALTFFLIIFIKRTQSSVLSIFTIFLHCFLMLSAALIVYRLGYGFDPFIHRAAEKYIYQFGSLAPKTFYYLGQYALVVILGKMTLLPLAWLDKILLPLFTALFLPPLGYLTLRHGLRLERVEARLGSILIFLIPFGSFIATTPQDLANFFALTLILFGVLYLTTRLIPFWVPLLLVLTTFFTHPLTGLPMLFFYLLLMLLGRFTKAVPSSLRQFKIAFLAVVFAVGIFVLPLAFILFAKAGFHLPSLKEILALAPPLPRPRPDHGFSPGFALIYSYKYFLPFLLVIVSLIGRQFINKKNPGLKTVSWLAWLAFLIFLLNAAFLKLAITFKGVGLPEQGQYPARLFNFSFYLILPLFLFGLVHLIKKGETYLAPTWLSGALALLLTASFYLSYPRVDAFVFSRYFNTSAADFQTVKQIEEKSNGQDYAVLSNISFSAAAIQEFGFKKYYETSAGPIFYYALPTGGPLYYYYEQMVYGNVQRETMNKVMDLTGAKQSYLVINDYWNSFKTAVPQAKLSADEWWEVEGGKILVFRYKR